MSRTLLMISTLLLTALGLTAPASSAAGAAAAPKVRHIFVINLENKGYATTWGPGSKAPYLSQTLRAKGQLLTQYYGIAHLSLGNYIAQVSGQGPNLATQLDCPYYANFTRLADAGQQQAVGFGCVYPSAVRTVADQLQAKGLSWKGYMQDMATPCQHPALNSMDGTQRAKPGAQYAARHDPFVYFHSIIDSPSCARHVVNLNALPGDLRSTATTPNLTYITPDLCEDGHDEPCVDGRPGGLVSADAFLRTWVPAILASPAYKKDGLLVITFDESDSSDTSACCGEGPGPNAPLPGLTGPGGGRTGALVLSRYVAAGSANATPYNHYGLLKTFEDTFGLGHLGYAGAPAVRSFGTDVYGAAKP